MKINISECIKAKLKESGIDTAYFSVLPSEIDKKEIKSNHYIEVIFDLPGKINNTGVIKNYRRFVEVIDHIYVDEISLKYSTTYVKDSELRIFFRVQISIEPVKPEEPVQSEEPVESDELEEPVKSDKLEEPIESDEPDEPVKSDKLEEPIESDEPDEPDETYKPKEKKQIKYKRKTGGKTWQK